jgi:dienelactone hydrolase
MRRVWIGVLAAAAFALSIAMLIAQGSGLAVTRDRVGTTPVTVYSAGEGPAPVVVIAHGFAGSQQLMAPFATTLARSGYLVVTYDALGHGRNPAPMTGDVTQVDGATAALVAELGRVSDWALGHPGGDGRLALLGHSMASDIVVRRAIEDSRVATVVAVSMFSPVVTAEAPANLLIISGAWEGMLLDEALRVTGEFAGGAAEPGVTYGDPAAGPARRAAVAPGVEHIGVLYSATSQREARDWLNATFGRTGEGAVDGRGKWIGLWIASAAVLAWAAAPVLPVVRRAKPAVPVPTARIIAAGLLPALATPPIAVLMPLRLVPVPVADYLVLHFAVYGLLTGLAIVLLHLPAPARPRIGPLAVAALALVVFAVLAVFLPLDRFVTAFLPTAQRAGLFLTLGLAVGLYFVADEWLTRGPGAPSWAYAFTKLAFLGSLALAIAIDLPRLFFLLIVFPVVVLFFVLFGLGSRWSRIWTEHPMPAALANAVLFAWAIAVTFPVLAG